MMKKILVCFYASQCIWHAAVRWVCMTSSEPFFEKSNNTESKATEIVLHRTTTTVVFHMAQCYVTLVTLIS